MKIQRGNPILCINSQRETVSKVLVLSLTGMKITQQIYPFCWCRAFHRLAPEINLDLQNYLYKRNTNRKTNEPLQDGIIFLFYTYINAKIKLLALYLLFTFFITSSTFYLSFLLRSSDFNDGRGVQKAPQISFFLEKQVLLTSVKHCKFGPQCHNGLIHRCLVYISKHKRFPKMNLWELNPNSLENNGKSPSHFRYFLPSTLEVYIRTLCDNILAYWNPPNWVFSL